jgi:hypothetical protein
LKYVALPHALSLSFVFFAVVYFEADSICACGFCCLLAILIAGSFYMYRDPFGFVKAFETRLTMLPYSVLAALAHQQPMAFIIGTFLSFILRGLLDCARFEWVPTPRDFLPQ